MVQLYGFYSMSAAVWCLFFRVPTGPAGTYQRT